MINVWYPADYLFTLQIYEYHIYPRMSHLPTYQPNWNGVFTCLPYSPQSTHNLASHPPLPSPSLRLPATPLNSPSSPPLQFLPSQQPQQKQGRFLVAPPLAVQQTKNSPLTPTAQYDQDQGVRKVGKALSCYTKRLEFISVLIHVMIWMYARNICLFKSTMQSKKTCATLKKFNQWVCRSLLIRHIDPSPPLSH